MIGMFDSGMGGLSVLSELVKAAPGVPVVYFGDIKNAPYGTKTREELGALTVLGFEKLISEGATHLVSACNSVSASIALPMFEILGIQPRDIIEMVGPAVEYFKGKEDKRILVAATPATIASGIYRLAFEHHGMRIIELPIPPLAHAIEEGRPREELDRIVENALAPVPQNSFDVVLLACTHYPFARESFERALYRRGSNAEVVDPAASVAKRAMERFGTDFTPAAEPSLRLIISADSEPFRQRAASLFKEGTYFIDVQKRTPNYIPVRMA